MKTGGMERYIYILPPGIKVFSSHGFIGLGAIEVIAPSIN